jgi:transposase
MTIARALQRHKITRKKKTLHAQEQDSPRVQAQRKAFKKKLAAVDPDHLVFVDETGANTGMTRTHGRAPQGERVQATAPGSWQNVTLIVGLRTSGVVAPMALPGAVDGTVFETYVEQVLVPKLQEGDVVVLDNLQPHKNPAVIAAIEAVGARVEPLPVYSPDLTPIEEMFSKTNAYLRKVAARTTDTVITAMGEALELVTPSDILGWFHDRVVSPDYCAPEKRRESCVSISSLRPAFSREICERAIIRRHHPFFQLCQFHFLRVLFQHIENGKLDFCCVSCPKQVLRRVQGNSVCHIFFVDRPLDDSLSLKSI